MKVFAFDVDGTLDVGDPPGPVMLEQLVWLKMQGNVIGLCGNYGAVFRTVRGWHNLFSFWNLMGKAKTLMAVKETMAMAGIIDQVEAFIMVGNDGDGVLVSSDKANAVTAKWDFVLAEDFKEGL
ncbi:MAG: hypothetical protein OK454_03250 [Thaumarchaeota archaeon]|nr:hypothetical protein [Nitrososphaerota archaeon]